LGKIADSLNEACHARERLGAAPGLRAQVLASGDEWAVEDVLCTLRPNDAAFEERHERYRVALVGAGSFQCCGRPGRELLTPGSLLLGNAGEYFECGHEHGTGDRCLAFGYSPEMFERLASEAGVRGRVRFQGLRVPPLDALAGIVAEAGALWTAPALAAAGAWDELGVRLAAAAVRLAVAPGRFVRHPRNAERGVARAVRLIERDPCARLDLEQLALEARLSRFHFIRTFARVTGLTPHRYLRRARLRAAAVRLAIDDRPILEVALACGFRDLSNFNHAFRAEFGAAPREYRRRQRRLGAVRPS
jgi:AraC-like DNA-binding protein